MKVLVALGGNAILQRGEEGRAEEQFRHVSVAVRQIIRMIRKGYRITVTHGNGPQVGDILLKNEYARSILPPMPLDICGAESQGMIGYMLQQTLLNQLTTSGLEIPVITVITQTRVDPNDPAFLTPEKPIGLYYTGEEAGHLRRERGWEMHRVAEGDQGFRRVVPSPDPLEIVEHVSIRTLSDEGFIVISAGGGGIPVCVNEGGGLEGVEAVIDKDLTAERLATAIGADTLLILTDVEYAYTGFGTGSQHPIERLSGAEAQELLDAGEFGEGTMAPKIKACIRFVESGGKAAVITSLGQALDALDGRAGTCILP